MAWSRPGDGLGQVTKEAALVVGLPGTPTRATAERWAGSIEDDIKTAGQTIANWHERQMKKTNWNGKTELKSWENLASS